MFRTIASNTTAQLLTKFFGAGLTLLTTYFTIRLAGLELYGDLTKILVLVAVGFTIIDFGLNAEAVRSSLTPTELLSHLQTVFLSRLFLSFLAIISLNLVIAFLPGGYSPAVKSVFWLGSLAIIFQGVYTSGNAYFQARLLLWRSALSVIVGSLFGALLTFYYLKYSPTLPHLVLANTLGYLVMAICSILLLPSLTSKGWRLTSIFPFLRRSLTLGLILIASVLASKIDTIILGVFRSSYEVGEYGLSYRIFDVFLVLPVFVMNAVYPFLVKAKTKGSSSALISQTTKSMVVLGVGAAIFLYLAAPFVGYLKPGLILAPHVLRLLSLSLPLFYVTAPLMWGLIALRRDKQVIQIYLAAAILNGFLNLIFIPLFGPLAAAIITGLTELFILLSLLYFSR
ncbi:hypothetical protein A2228_03075 [Candidatus Collierbacteria bacterium RIFOXYA2_FULL_46_10]|uniref:Uncharacterized protein n=1 Tax=Candidatus Collierbacteria bacterium RIFOXYA2_FULL_46_10 TaxID=1817726 RepID=A0A1F5F3C3_9BACT|nr:MAG: hypothetical protein A2228_03075 [Candidatus Collierbacteria bacterium RIFOXYA2_FULL_46_10]